MKLFKRFFYYGIGLIVGSIFVGFIWNKKDVVFNYFPNARLLSNISQKKLVYSVESKKSLELNSIDSLTVNQILKNGDADFWNKIRLDSSMKYDLNVDVNLWNKIKLDSCTQYDINGEGDFKNIIVTIVNCDSVAVVKKITISE